MVFAAMAIIFTCSWLPYFTIKLLLGMRIQVLLNVMEAVVIIRYITSFAKPLLYTGVFQTRLLVFLAKSVAKQGKRQPFGSKKLKYSPKLSGRLRSRSSVNNSKLASLESKRQGSRINREKNVTFTEEALHTRLV